MKKLVIFGVGQIAELAHHYFSTDSDYEVVAFTVDAAYRLESEFFGLPVVPFESISEHFPPSEYSMFIALSYSGLNSIRANKFSAARQLGYGLASYVSSRANYLSSSSPGENCFILEDNTIQPFVRIGENVTLWSGNHIGHHSTLADHCFISSHVVISGGVTVGAYSFIGVNATLRDHITIGEKCVLGAGVLILTDAEAGGVYMGTASPRSKIPSSRLRGL
ncbi:acetyltransferase [Pseudomonas maioricensis]|uniref:acetyltransferase n=1 Tax=Pseudomonas maioricensis TaxID=1766623 RepID=UPI001FAB6209